MKKFFCITLSICILLTTFSFGVSASSEAPISFGAVDASYAPQGTPVSDSAGFAAMSANGTYYLDKDIVIDSTWNAGAAVNADYAANTAFTGVLDGNGHTITTTAPLFANFSGTVKNLTVVGEIAPITINETLLNGANIALWTNGKATFENIYTKATVVNGADSAALIAFGDTGCEIIVKNCRNDANITGENRVAGLVGFITDKTVYIENSENHGNIASTGNYGTGIMAILGYKNTLQNAADIVCTIKNCANYGDVSGVKNQSAGILSYLRGNGIIENCVNYGNITNPGMAGGILGRTDDVSRSSAVSIANCSNYGKITGGTYVGGIAAQLGAGAVLQPYAYIATNCANFGDVCGTAVSGKALYVGGVVASHYCGTGSVHGILNSLNAGNVYADASQADKDVYVAGILASVTGAKFQFQNNINVGNISVTGNATYKALTFINSAKAALSATAGNYSVELNDIPAAVCTVNGVSFDESMAKAVSEAKMASGEIVYTVNSAIGAETFYQIVGNAASVTTIAAENGANTVLKNDDGTYANPVIEAPPTGDTAILSIAFICTAALFAVAFVSVKLLKKEEN